MKYNILLPYREYLNQKFSNKNTADRYYFAIKKLFHGINFNDINDLDNSIIEQQLASTKTKHDLSAAKNGLKHLAVYCNTEVCPDKDFFRIQSKRKRTRRSRSYRIINLDKTKRKINSLQNEKLKLAYRLMLVSGLRVSETAALTKNDININADGSIRITVHKGKGGRSDEINCMYDPYLTKRLSEYLADRHPSEKVFYSASTMKQYAGKLGIECHNLRRISAIMYRRQQLSSCSKVYDANNQTQRFLRHVRFSTTKRYLFNRKLIAK